MDIEEVEEKRPRFLWVVVVAVVAAALAVFIVIRSGRMEPKVAEVEPERLGEVEPVPAAQEQTPPTPVSPAEEAVPAEGEPVEEVSAAEVPAAVPPPQEKPAVQEKPRVKPRPKPAVTQRQPPSESEPLVLPTSESAHFVVQVGAYKDERVARVQADKMERYGYKAWVESADVPGQGRFYRVRIGGFDTLSDAERVATSMSRVLGEKCWVDNR